MSKSLFRPGRLHLDHHLLAAEQRRPVHLGRGVDEQVGMPAASWERCNSLRDVLMPHQADWANSRRAVSVWQPTGGTSSRGALLAYENASCALLSAAVDKGYIQNLQGHPPVPGWLPRWGCGQRS